MGAHEFEELRQHIGHKIECVCYGDPPVNVSVECITCGEVLMDLDSTYENNTPT